MKPRIIATLVVLSAVLGVGAGFLVKRVNDDNTDPKSSTGQEPTATKDPTEDPTKSPSDDEDDSAADVPELVAKNRAERTGPSWSPADLLGPDGKPLEIGNVFPGTFQPVRVGDNVDKYVAAGYLAADIERESVCEGNYWKWAGQLSSGLDVIADDQGVIGSLGLTKDGLETPEGISIGNSLQALRDTYGKELSGPEGNEYGLAGMFLQGNGDGWLGFGFDASPDELKPTSRITFIEASKGSRPGMLRDGC